MDIIVRILLLYHINHHGYDNVAVITNTYSTIEFDVTEFESFLY